MFRLLKFKETASPPPSPRAPRSSARASEVALARDGAGLMLAV